MLFKPYDNPVPQQEVVRKPGRFGHVPLFREITDISGQLFWTLATIIPPLASGLAAPPAIPQLMRSQASNHHAARGHSQFCLSFRIALDSIHDGLPFARFLKSVTLQPSVSKADVAVALSKGLLHKAEELPKSHV